MAKKSKMVIEIFAGFEYEFNEQVCLGKGEKLCFVKGKKNIRAFSIGSLQTSGEIFIKCRYFGENKKRKVLQTIYNPITKKGSCFIEKKIVEIYRTKRCANYVAVFIKGKYKYKIKKWR